MPDQKLTDRTELTAFATGDKVHVVDVSDTTDNAQGTSKWYLISTLSGYLASLAQTLTNKTLTSPVINTPTGDVVTITGSETLTNKTLTSPVINTGVSGTAILDEDDMASNSAIKIATQQSIKAYADSAIQTATDAATITFDLQTGANRKHRVVLGGNRILALIEEMVGQIFIIMLTQDSTGSRTVTWFPAGSDTITMTLATPGVVTTTLDLKTGTPVVFTTTGTLPTGITAGTRYYWIRTAATTGNVATSKANALAGTAIATSVSQSGVHTMKPQILWPTDTAPTLSTGKHAIDYFGFVIQSTGQITGTVISQDM